MAGEPTWEEIVEEDRRLSAERRRKRALAPHPEPESEHAKALGQMIEAEERHAREADLERADGIRDDSAIVRAVLS